MASAGSEKTLPCPASKTTSPALALKFDALDFPAMKAMEDFQVTSLFLFILTGY